MQKQNKSLRFLFLIGALLIAGLFFYRWQAQSPEAEVSPSNLSKPESTQGNQVQTSPIVTAPVEEKVELKKSRELRAEDLKKWQVFEEILNSKNDNDPRVDRELRSLSPELHENLRQAYSSLPDENRNGRGFIVFLLTRDLKDVKDLQFLNEVYKESPCLSFQSCSQTAPPDPHFDGVNETSLNYPQLAGLYQLQRQLESRPDLLNSAEMKSVIQNTLREARQFPSAAIQKRAQEIQEKYGL